MLVLAVLCCCSCTLVCSALYAVLRLSLPLLLFPHTPTSLFPLLHLPPIRLPYLHLFLPCAIYLYDLNVAITCICTLALVGFVLSIHFGIYTTRDSCRAGLLQLSGNSNPFIVLNNSSIYSGSNQWEAEKDIYS